MTADDPSPLHLWILDEAYDFPEPIWHLVQPTTVVLHHAAPDEPQSVHHDGPQPAAVKAALVDLLDQGLLQLMHAHSGEPALPAAPADRHRLLDDAATWQPRSSVCVFTTPAGDRIVEAAFADDSSPYLSGPHAP